MFIKLLKKLSVILFLIIIKLLFLSSILNDVDYILLGEVTDGSH